MWLIFSWAVRSCASSFVLQRSIKLVERASKRWRQPTGQFCPVGAMSNFLKVLRMIGRLELTIFQKGSPMSRWIIVRSLQRIVWNMPNANRNTSHSFRIDRATAVANVPIAQEQIQTAEAAKSQTFTTFIRDATHLSRLSLCKLTTVPPFTWRMLFSCRIYCDAFSIQYKLYCKVIIYLQRVRNKPKH